MVQNKSVRFLFRFRDLVGDTINEHSKIIEKNGNCWWGWWKRPNEDNHIEVWKELESTASEKTPALVGLFHSGKDCVYIAHVTGVIKPNTEPEDEGRPPVPEGEENLIPSYYRKSPYSAAWLKLKKIERKRTDFFTQYSFAEVPNLPNYTQTVLKRFKGKIIIEPEELRGMDTTIWVVRKRKTNDDEEKIILTIKAIPEPVSKEVIQVKGNNILHITDLHYATGNHKKQHVWALEGEDTGLPTMAESIANALKNENIGLVLVTGDLTFKGDLEEYEAASKGLNLLLGMLDLGKENLVVVPGNHDIVWTQSDAYDKMAEVRFAPPEATTNYRKFYRDLFRHEPNKHLSMGRRFLLPAGLPIEIAALNSSSLETGANFYAGMGRVQEASFERVANTMGWSHSKPSAALRVLALHHHLALTENLELAQEYYKGFGIAVDAVRIQRMAADYGVQLAVHGHKHRAFIWRSGVYELPEDAQPQYRLGELSIVGGGSAGSKETDGNKNYFNLLDVEASGLTLKIFRSENQGKFQKMSTFKGGFRLSEQEPGLVLSDWRRCHEE